MLLFQAVRNVVDNAINVTKLDTTVEVKVKPTGTICVIDEGPGVSDEESRLIFQRFWRRNRDRQFGGAGLGLSIVSRIVEAHGGSVKVVNRPTGGAIFYLNLSGAAELNADASPYPTRDGRTHLVSGRSEAASA
jgi:signal transduction histidine kinase